MFGASISVDQQISIFSRYYFQQENVNAVFSALFSHHTIIKYKKKGIKEISRAPVKAFIDV